MFINRSSHFSATLLDSSSITSLWSSSNIAILICGCSDWLGVINMSRQNYAKTPIIWIISKEFKDIAMNLVVKRRISASSSPSRYGIMRVGPKHPRKFKSPVTISVRSMSTHDLETVHKQIDRITRWSWLKALEENPQMSPWRRPRMWSKIRIAILIFSELKVYQSRMQDQRRSQNISTSNVKIHCGPTIQICSWGKTSKWIFVGFEILYLFDSKVM